MKRKVENPADLVPMSTLVRLADKLVRSARGIAVSKGLRAKVIGGMKHDIPKVTNNQVTINVLMSRTAMAFEKGSGLHDPKNPHFIEIAPKNKPYLVFEGTNAFQGELIKTKHVNHPGVAPKPFLEPAKEKWQPEFKKAIAEEAGKNIRLVLKGMSVKIDS